MTCNFGQAADRWDLERLYEDLATAKQTWAPYKRRKLTDTEKEHLRGLLCDCSPTDIAKTLHKQPSTVEEALSTTLYRYAETLTDRSENSLNHWREIQSWLEAAGYKKGSLNHSPTVDWGEAPDVSLFFDRAAELRMLSEWIIAEKCRVVAILGMGGIGKTALSVKLAQQVQDDFEYVIWRSLRYTLPWGEFGDRLRQLFSLPDSSDIGQIIKFCQQHRCLLVLDGVENILSTGELAGQYHRTYQGYEELIGRLAESSHQSCLIITNQEKTREIACLAGCGSPVRTIKLPGLEPAAAAEILKQKQLLEQQNWQSLIELYQGNPLALKIVATTIQDIFGGSVDLFLRHSSMFLGDFSEILKQHFQRLSALEKQILYGLALEGLPVTIADWRDALWSGLSITELIQAIESLWRRSLLEQSQKESLVYYSLQPAVSKYVKNQLIEQICKEILVANRTETIKQNSLLKSQVLLQFNQKISDDLKIINYRKIQVKVEARLRLRLAETHPETVEAEVKNLLSLIPARRGFKPPTNS